MPFLLGDSNLALSEDTCDKEDPERVLALEVEGDREGLLKEERVDDAVLLLDFAV